MGFRCGDLVGSDLVSWVFCWFVAFSDFITFFPIEVGVGSGVVCCFLRVVVFRVGEFVVGQVGQVGQVGGEDPKTRLEKIKRQLSAGTGTVLLHGPLLKRSETVSFFLALP